MRTVIYLLPLAALAWLVNPIVPLPVHAQISTANDGTGTGVSIQGNQIFITGGSLSGNGSNLFHSFQQFGLNSNQIATFVSSPQIQNILGRVTGGSPSVINGQIHVTGGTANLYLMNPAGILFGPNASLNVPAAFTATTANGIGFGGGWFNGLGANTYSSLIGNPNGFAFSNSSGGAIANTGNLTVGTGQSITLLGGWVINTGTITAPRGTITILAVPGGKLVQVSQDGSLLSLDLPIETKAVLNAQTISPVSLPALLTGGGFSGNATQMTVENGQVKLAGSGIAVSETAGSVVLSGRGDVTSAGVGGTIAVSGDRVALMAVTLDASGATGGGTVRVGGDYQGTGTLPRSLLTTVDRNSKIHADAIVTGNGGQVVVWSAGTTDFAGTVSAQGGLKGGNGGLVETSAQQSLRVEDTAIVNTRAGQGTLGTWLVDPTDLTVQSGGTATISGGTNTPPTATTIDAATVVTGLSGSNVNLQASNSITVNQVIDASGNAGGGNLTLTTPTATLNQPITLKSGSSLSGTATTVNVGASGTVQNGVDVVASGGTVNLAAATYTLANTVSINKTLTLNGQGAANTKVNGNHAVRVFNISGPGTTATISGLTIQNGRTSGAGGGIYNNGGSVTLTNSTLSGNSASGSGGGILSIGSVTLTNSTLSGNSANGSGGGIANSGGSVTLTNSTLSGNSASISGGGIASGTVNSDSVTLTNSTLSGNSANSAGGGIFSIGGSVTLTTSTLSGNSATAFGGGGIFSTGGSVTLANNIIAGNSATTAPDISGATASQGYNLIGNTTGGSGFISSDLQNVNPLLAPLGNYGGPTQTLALLLGSPAIDAGKAPGATTADQRGVAAYGTRDIGAFESLGFTLTASANATPQTTKVNTAFGQPLTVQVTSPYGEPVAGGMINFSLPPSAASATLSASTAVIGSAGQASVTATANGVVGSYIVSATTQGAPGSASFNLTNALVTSPITTPPITISPITPPILPLPIIPSPPYTPPPPVPTPVPTLPISLPPEVRANLPPLSLFLPISSEPLIVTTPTILPQGLLPSPLSSNGSSNAGAIGLNLSTFLSLVDIAKVLDVQPLISALRIPQLVAVAPEANLIATSKARLLDTLNRNPAIDLTLHGAFDRYLSNPTDFTLRVQSALPDNPLAQSWIGITQKLANQNPDKVYSVFKQSFLEELQTNRDIVFSSLTGFSAGQFNLINNLAQGNLDNAVSDLELLKDAEFTNAAAQNPANELLTAAGIRQILHDIATLLKKTPAVLYAFPLSDRLELLLVTPEGKTIHRAVAVSAAQLRELTQEFLRQVTNSDSPNYLAPSQKLYDVLIRPMASELQKQEVDMILFSLDGSLRSIPVAALHDGQQFLVEKYSLGLIPSVSLTDVRYRGLANARVLAMGASTFPQTSLTDLPGVSAELSLITPRLWPGQAFLNEGFTLNNLKTQRGGREIVHLATHAEFSVDTAGNSNAYIQLWDTRLAPDQLRGLGWTSPTVELLVLSACKTAIGNDAAELGFAGLAVRTGVKSVLASLWSVNDVGTLGLMYGFYDRLKTEPIKAEALRQAQIAMIRKQLLIRGSQLITNQQQGTSIPLPFTLPSVDLSHPFYWSGFTMIGSPW